MVNQLKIIVLSLVITLSSFGQNIYFQQEVNYKIDVTLNDSLHFLFAKEKIQYINNSNTELTELFFHLWPNAYKNNKTALAKQLLQQGRTELYFSKPKQRGYIDSLDFIVNGKKIKWQYDKEHEDICKLILNEPLPANDTLIIETPFRVKLPDAKFSRLGHTQQAYFITQWYPKPAVFDNTGWHQMPYLDQGEFYSEFGSFDVSITLPKNYVLAATGDRIDEDAEDDFLNEKVKYTLECLVGKPRNDKAMEFPPSSKETKTIQFKQYRVHDFAWFADKRFYVLHDQIDLPTTKRTIDTWAFFTDKNFELWKESINYINESTLFYSYLNGDYPYNHVTAVDGTIMAGGGMEYPNITVIGDVSTAFDLDITIAHEVGHNWFYGILGSNERDFPGLDEGVNSFYEMRYMQAKYPNRKLVEILGRDSTSKLFGLNKIPYWREKEIAYYMSSKYNLDQPINTKSQDFSELNYGSVVYSKTPIILDYLMEYMGQENFDKAMQFYYDKFKFKHPSPQDLFKTLSYFSGVDMNWFSENLILTNKKIDYKIKSVKRNEDGSYALLVKNKSNATIPTNVTAFKNGKAIGQVWYQGFKGKKVFEFPDKDVDYFKIDGFDRMPDICRTNNYCKANGLFKKAKPIQLNFLTKFQNPYYLQLNYLPLIAGNYYNGLMLGIGLHNYELFQKKFEFAIAPMYAFRSKTLAGNADICYNLRPKHRFEKITFGAKIKSYNYDEFKFDDINKLNNTNYEDFKFAYYKLAPYLTFNFKKKKYNNNIQQSIKATFNFIYVDSLQINSIDDGNINSFSTKLTQSNINQIEYNYANKHILHNHKLQVMLLQAKAVSRVGVTLNYNPRITPKKTIEIRMFAGVFLSGNESDKAFYRFRMRGQNGGDDYLFETNSVARNLNSGIGFMQFNDVEGAFKVYTPLGNSTKWIASLNIKTPNLFIFKLYADLGIADKSSLLNDKILYNAGVNITLIRDIVDVYIPLLFNKDIKNVLELNNINGLDRIRFTFNLHKLEPKTLLKNNLF